MCNARALLPTLIGQTLAYQKTNPNIRVKDNFNFFVFHKFLVLHFQLLRLWFLGQGLLL